MNFDELRIYVSINSNKEFERMVDDMTKGIVGVRYYELSMDSNFIISDDWQRFGSDMSGIFVGHSNYQTSNLSRKKNVAFMCFEDGLVYTPRSLALILSELEAERIVAEEMPKAERHRIESMTLHEYLTEWAPLLMLKV